MLTIDARSFEPDTALSAILDTLKRQKPGTELALTLPQPATPVLRGLAEHAPLPCWFSPRQPGQYTLVARDTASRPGVTEYLSWDHDRLDATLATGLSAAAGGDWARANECVQAFRLGLLRHIDIEEKMLFPAFEERTGMHHGGPTQVMRMEHEGIQECVAGIVSSAGRHDSDDLMRWHANLLGVLVEHNMKEEQILYPGIDRVLDDGDRAQMITDMLLA